MLERDLVELVDRQFNQVLALDGAAFVRQLQRCLSLLAKEPRVAALLEDMQRDAAEMVRKLWKEDDQGALGFIELRHEFVRLFPAADDAGAHPPGPDQFDYSWQWTLACFDRLVENFKHDYPSTDSTEETTLTGRLFKILAAKMDTAGNSTASAEEIEAFQKKFHEMRDNHLRIVHRFIDEKLTSGCVALPALNSYLFAVLDPVGFSLDVYAEQEPKEPGFSPFVSGGSPRYNLYDRNGIGREADKAQALERDVAKYKGRVRQLHEELRFRIGTRLSLLGLMNRFQHRCQWHDRQRLHEIAKAAKRKPEEALTAELALWLFDQGLSPVSKPMMAGLQPDLTDPSFKFNLYVEAKQYDKGAKKYLVKGFHQLWDTVSGLKGTPYEVHEAFYVVFRRGGPRYVLPSSIPGEGWTAHLRLIDIAPATIRGSRGTEKPITIAAEELMPLSR